MTTKASFTDSEWARLKRAPFIAGMALSAADPGGPIEVLKETTATLKAVLAAADSGGQGELVDELAGEAREDARQHVSPLRDFKPKAATAREAILEELGEVNRIVSEKASPEDAAALRDWLATTAQAAANAAKEGGFMGFHAERVSEREQRMLDDIRDVLSTQG